MIRLFAAHAAQAASRLLMRAARASLGLAQWLEAFADRELAREP